MNPPALELRERLDRRARSRAACLAAERSRGEPHASSAGGRILSGTESWRRSGRSTGRNRIVARFYDGPGWVKFRPWEQGFLMIQGGVRRARMEILRHVLSARASRAHGARGRDRQR